VDVLIAPQESTQVLLALPLVLAVLLVKYLPLVLMSVSRVV